MGQDATCTLHYDGQVARGKAQLEQHELIFRGPVRLAIPLAQIKSAVASGNELTVKFGRRTAIFDLGASASGWASRITHPRSRIDKLGVKSGMTVLMAGVVDPDLLDDVVAQGAELLKTRQGWRRRHRVLRGGPPASACAAGRDQTLVETDWCLVDNPAERLGCDYRSGSDGCRTAGGAG